MRQFRDNYSGALVFRQSPEEEKQSQILKEIKEIRDEIVSERQKLEELKSDANTTKRTE